MLKVSPENMANRIYNSVSTCIINRLNYIDCPKVELAHTIAIENSISVAQHYILYANANKIVYSVSKKSEILEMTEKYYWEQVLNAINTVYKPLNFK